MGSRLWRAVTGAVVLVAVAGPVVSAVASAAAAPEAGDPTVSLSSDAGLATEVNYSVAFTVTAPGGLAAGHGSITLVAPPGTVFPTSAADYTITDATTKTASPIDGSPAVAGGGSVVSITPIAAVAAGEQVSVGVADVTNPPAGPQELTVATSPGNLPVSAPTYRLVTATGAGGPTVALSSYAALASQVTYTVGFRTSAQGGLVANQGTITLSGPPGTVWPDFGPDYTITGAATNTTTPVVATPVVADGEPVVTVTLPTAIAPGQRVTLAVTGVTNPPAGTGALTVATSSDIVGASTPAYRLVTATGAGGPTVALSSYAALASQVTYTVGFRTSAQGGLAANHGSITLLAPRGTVFPPNGPDYAITDVTDKTTSVVPGDATVDGGGSVVSVTVPSALPAGQQVSLAVSGVTNPPPGPQVLTIETSSDLVPTAAPAYRLVAAKAVGAPAVSLAPSTGLASQVTYTVGFTTTAQGALAASLGTITLEAPQGTVFPAAAQDYSITDLSTTTTSAVPRPPSVVDGGSVVSVPVNAAIAAGQHVSLAVAGVVNPPPGPFAFTLETSSDSLPVSTPTYRLAPATGVTGGALSLSPSRALATGATWKVHFDTNTRGALAAGHGVIVLAAPAGTGLPSSGGDYLVSAGGAPGAAPSELQLLAGGSTADITVPDAVADSSPVSVVVSGVTNPGAGTAPLEVSTSSQAAPVALPAVLSGAGAAARTGPVTVLSARPSSTAAGAGLVSYVLRLRTSAHGALATGPAGAAATGTITVTGPAGTRFPACPSGCSGPAYLVDGQNVADPEVSGDLSTVSLPVPADIGPSQVVTLTLNGATNPASPGPQALSVRTSADTSPVRATFTTTAPGRVSALSAHLSSSTAGAPGVAYTVRFRTGPGAPDGDEHKLGPGHRHLARPGGHRVPQLLRLRAGVLPDLRHRRSCGRCRGGGPERQRLDGDPGPARARRRRPGGRDVHRRDDQRLGHRAAQFDVMDLFGPGAGADGFRADGPGGGLGPVGRPVQSRRRGIVGGLHRPLPHREPRRPAKGVGPLQGGAGAAPFGSVTLLAPSGTAFPVCFSYEQGCFPTYLIDGQEVVPGGGSVAANGSMVTLAVPKPVAAGQEVSVSIDEMANSGAPGPGSMTVWTSSDPVPVRARFALTAPAAVGSAALSLSSTAAGASGVAYHVAFTTSSSGALPPGFGAGQGGVGATTTETVFVEGPVGTNFANCTLSCPYYPTYLVDGQDAPGALFSAGGRVLSLALPAAVASSSRVALSLDGVTSSPTPGPKTLMVWTSSDPRPVPLAYSLGAPAAVSHPSLRISDSATGAVATYTVTLRTSASGALETGPDGGSASGPGEPGTITLIGPRGTVFAGCSGGCPYTVDGHGGVPAVDLSASGAAVSVVVPADVPAGSDLTLSAPGVVNSPGAGPQVLKVWTSSDHVAQSVPFELVAAGKAPKPRPRPGPVAKPRPQPQPAGAKPSVFTVLPTPASSFASVTHDLENAGVTVAALLFITFPSQLFNSTFEENYEDIKAWWEKKLRFLGKARRKLAERKREGRSERSNAWAFAVVLVVGALLGNLINPHFGADLSSLASFLAVVAAIVTGMSVAATVNIVYRRRRHGADQAHPHLKALPAGLAIAAACVLVSRLADFAPGYLYGLICGVAFSRQLAKHEKGHVIALSTVATLAVATVVWFAWVPVQGSVSHGHAGFGLVLLDDFLGSLFVSGLVGSVIGMLPLRFLPGGDLAAWHRGAWAAVFGVALFGMLQAMLRPVSHSHVGHAPIVTVIILLVLFGGGSLVFRQHFARREREKKAAEQAAGQAGEQAGQAGEAVAHAGQAVAQGEAVGHAPPPPESPAAAPAAGAHD